MYNDMIQEISLLYIQILKKEAKISQKEMIKSLGASESLLSRWKSGERKIGGEYYPLLEVYFRQAKFDSYFEDKKAEILEYFPELDEEITAQQFWDALFHGHLDQQFFSMEQYMDLLYQILEERRKKRNLEISVFLLENDKAYPKKYLEVLMGERKIQVFMKNRSSLCIEESGKQKVIGPKQLSKIGWVSDFYLGIKEQVTPEELIYLNQYAEIILKKLLILR